MKQYIGTKIVQAEPWNRPEGAGYKVVDADGYEWWCPVVAFNDAYRPCDAMTFGLAIEALKRGKKVARCGWNGKGMWLVLVPGSPLVNMVSDSPYMRAGITSCEILPHIDMWTVNAHGRRAMLPGWLASQTDMLAEDWEVVQ